MCAPRPSLMSWWAKLAAPLAKKITLHYIHRRRILLIDLCLNALGVGRHSDIARESVLVCCLATLMALGNVQAVIVDGKLKGPNALKNQSHEENMIDGYNTKTCGIADPDMKTSHFVNEAREGQFPWLVSLQVLKKGDMPLYHFCMGAFISDKWILSAAHCYASSVFQKRFADNEILLTAGSSEAHGPSNINLTVSRIYYHPKFDRNSPIGFDVALIELAEKVPIKTKFDGQLPFINTVCLPSEGKEYSKGQAVKIAGWGDTEHHNSKSKPEHLMTTDLVITNGTECAEIFTKHLKKVRKHYQKYKDFICAEWHGDRDACQGDSGAPLLEYADGKAVAVGIVSYGLGCAVKGAPGVYTRTSSFIPWIKDITQNKDKATVQHVVINAP